MAYLRKKYNLSLSSDSESSIDEPVNNTKKESLVKNKLVLKKKETPQKIDKKKSTSNTKSNTIPKKPKKTLLSDDSDSDYYPSSDSDTNSDNEIIKKKLKTKTKTKTINNSDKKEKKTETKKDSKKETKKDSKEKKIELKVKDSKKSSKKSSKEKEKEKVNKIVDNRIFDVNKVRDEKYCKDYFNETLKIHWGYDSLKDAQMEIIQNIICNRCDIAAILATGYGKSICYQLPHVITKKSVIVISPLLALIHEQGLEMRNKGVDVAIFNSTTNEETKKKEKREMMMGKNKLVFMTPEYFVVNENFIKNISDSLLMVCIDEAHAVSTWGLDFRVSYTKLSVIREWLPHTPILTLTATAGVKVRQDINNILKLQNPKLITGSFDRPNLLIKVEPKNDNLMFNILNKYKNEYIIIYSGTKKGTEELSTKIENILKIKCEAYHAGLSDTNRNLIQQQFIDGKVKCIVATIAFGMGINIPNIRLVIHYNCPKNMEGYYQEIGRAGRDGQDSECVLFYCSQDFSRNKYFLRDMKNLEQKKYQENQIKQIELYAYSLECRRKIILQNFGQTINSCSKCDNCIKKQAKITYKQVDYSKHVYILLSLINKLNDSFGSGMCLYVLFGKNAKIKVYMKKYPEYNIGPLLAKEYVWKDLIQKLKLDEIIDEKSIGNSFVKVMFLTNKGLDLVKKLFSKYPSYLVFAQKVEKNEIETNFQFKFNEIKSK